MPLRTETLRHPAFEDIVREVEGADLIRKYKDAGWLHTEAPAPIEKTPAPVVDSPAPATPDLPDSPKEN